MSDSPLRSSKGASRFGDRIKAWLRLAMLATVSAIGLSACDQAESDPRIGDPLVRIVSVAPASPAERTFTGTIAARVQSDLGFGSAGKVIERLIDTGQTVQAGTALMRIDPTDYEHAITAQAGNVAAAKARLIQAVADEKRYRRLLPSGAVSASEYDAAKAAADAAKALLDAAQAQLKVAQDESQYSTLVADADGTVVETLAEPGQVVTAGQIVVRVAHAGPREAAISLPETIRPEIGSVAQASLYGSDARWTALLRQLSDAADPINPHLRGTLRPGWGCRQGPAWRHGHSCFANWRPFCRDHSAARCSSGRRQRSGRLDFRRQELHRRLSPR